MAFVLFLLLNALLFIRPEELWPETAGARLYLAAIFATSLLAVPALVRSLHPRELLKQPISVCVVGLLAVTGLSLLARGRVDDAAEFAPEFGKVVIYYLLFVSVVNTPARLRTFLGFLVLVIAVVAVLGQLQYHGAIDFAALQPVEQRDIDPTSGEVIYYPRLCGAGIFNDPNDLCLALTLGVICCGYRASTAGGSLATAAWLAPVVLFGYTMLLTRSRGGMLGLIAAGAAYLVAKVGWRRALPLILAGPPIVLLLIGGRQANIGLEAHDTAYERVMLWAEGLNALVHSPSFWLTGIGAGTYADYIGRVAHNSFVHAYVELGLLGGTLFLVPFALAVRVLYRLCRPLRRPLPPGLAAFAPFVLAAVVGYCGGMYSLSRNYVVPTFLCLGLAASYLAMAVPVPPARFRVSPVWARETLLVGVGGLAFLKVFTQVAGLLGG